MRNILIFEDNRTLSTELIILFTKYGYHIDLVEEIPSSLESLEFKRLLERARNHEFDAVVWDAFLERGAEMVNIVKSGHIEAFKKVFDGPMIAWSQDPDTRLAQMAAGCTHQVNDKKSMALLSLLADLLDHEIA